MSDQQPGGKKRGCFFYGCITAIVIFVLGVVLSVLAFRYAVNTMVEQFTTDKPAVLQKVELPAAEMTDLQKRVDAFKSALNVNTNGFELILSAKEFNALLNTDTNLTAMKDKFFIQLDDDKVKADVSLPLDGLARFPLGRLKGRYFNGSAGLKIALSGGQLNVNLDSITINGQPVPGEALAHLRSQNLAQDVEKDPKKAEAIGKFESIEIKDGKIIIKVKPPSGQGTKGKPENI